MTTRDTILLVIIAVSTVVASFLALAETALTRINRVKAITLEEEGRRGAARLVRLIEHPERFLNPVLLLMLLSHLVIATLVGVLAEEHFGAGGVAIATVLETAIIF